MIITSTNDLKGYIITEYCGLVNTNLVVGVNVISDWFASYSDFFGGYSSSYQSKLDGIYKKAIQQLEIKAKLIGADAIIGVNIDFDEVSGKGKDMFMITVYGTAVKTILAEKEKRFEVYQKLYNLHLFKESGIITPEQYEAERYNILLHNEEKISQDLNVVKAENEHDESIKEAILLEEQLHEKKQKELELKEKQKQEEFEERVRQFELEAREREKDQQIVNNAIEKFRNNASSIYIKAKNLLDSNVNSPRPTLDKLQYSEIIQSNYDDVEINKSDKISYVIGRFIKDNRVAEACKYYIDTYHEEDVEYVKSYINSVYDIITLQKQSAFETMATRLIELKYLGKVDEAIDEFMKYSVCDKDIAVQVIELL